MKKKIKSLDLIEPFNSGLEGFDPKKLESELRELQEHKQEITYDSNFYKLFGYLLSGRYESFEELIAQDPSLSSIEIKSLKILKALIEKKEIKETDIFPFAVIGQISKKRISDKLARTLIWLIRISLKHSSDFKNNFSEIKNSLWDLAEILPEIIWHYSLFILEEKITDEYDKVFEKISQLDPEQINNAEQNIFDAEELAKDIKLKKIWKYFLLVIYYRRIGDYEKAELLLQEYRKYFDLELFKPVQIVGLSNETFFPAEDILTNWSLVLGEIDALQKESETLAVLETYTCEYFSCSDCCSNTFPTMSLTEYEYLKNWLITNNYDINKIKERAEAIQKEHLEKYGSRLPIVDKSLPENSIRGIENPHAFKFSCPFLEDGKCSIHPARPLICRGFGLSTDNGVSIKTCNYYQAQYRSNSGPENKRYVYDLRHAQMLARASDRHLSNGQELKGTIVAWFSQFI